MILEPDPELMEEQAEIRLLRSENLMLRAVLNELVTLKDGPRNAEYDRRKPVAWDLARDLLKRETP